MAPNSGEAVAEFVDANFFNCGPPGQCKQEGRDNAGVDARPSGGVSLMRTALVLAIGLAAVVSGVPASFAQDSRVLDHGKPAGTGIEAEERQTHQRPGSNTGISLAVPIGRVCGGP